MLKNKPDTLVDQAVFRIGLIYADPENSFADYQKAIEYFQSIPEKYPWSQLNARAGQWILTLRKLEDQSTEIMALKKETSVSEKRIEELNEANGLLIDKIKVLKLECMKDLKNKEETNQLLLKRIKTLELQIEDLKKIDLGKENQ